MSVTNSMGAGVSSSLGNEEHGRVPTTPESMERLPYVGSNDEYYKMTHTRRGQALIFNHNNIKGMSLREGTNVDCNNLKSTLEKLRFEVLVFEDQTKSEITNILKKTADTDHTDADCLLIVVLTHGNRDDKLYCSDGKYKQSKLWKPFLGTACKSLAGKPKLFFIQACRGSEIQQPVQISTTSSDDKFDVNPFLHVTHVTIPDSADLLIMNSTIENHVSVRNKQIGSWFISSLCVELNARALKNDLMTILTAVNRRVAYVFECNMPKSTEYHKKKQIPYIGSTLTRLIKFY